MTQHVELDFAGLSNEQRNAVEELRKNCGKAFFDGVSPARACESFREANRLMASDDPATKKRGENYNRLLLELYTQKP